MPMAIETHPLNGENMFLAPVGSQEVISVAVLPPLSVIRPDEVFALIPASPVGAPPAGMLCPGNKKDAPLPERLPKERKSGDHDHFLNLSQSSFLTNAVRERPSFVRALKA